ncbi:hypothetical protein AVEN_71211-1 [Araneus ventricosus]|uniref:Uncharacterized protein n=1 Tax=Araneus ventricosus TaxID=182803 RepID=A0A4Y2IPT9_ARAVE|nr:hypothetical protein AVEN_71211-1 [Araneus ventricosus]
MHLLKKVLMMLHCLYSPPVHHWYQGSRPGGCLSIDCNRRYQTTLTRFLSGNIRSLTSSDNSKCFEIPPKCTAEQATPDHVLSCLGLSKQDIVSNPLLNTLLMRAPRNVNELLRFHMKELALLG